MIRVKPFAALRPRPEQASQVACVPYDVVSTREARVLAAGNPISFLHAVRPEINLPDTTDPHDDAVYARAKSEFDRFAREVFVRESQPSMYLYRQEMTLLGRRVSQTGVVACCHIDDYEKGLIKKHEKTRRDKEDDRTRYVLEQNANAEPVFFLFKDRPDLIRLIEEGSRGGALYDFTAVDGVRHTLWRVASAGPYVAAFQTIPAVYVADGHHRTAAAARAGIERKRANPGHTGDEEYNWFLSVLFPASRLTILPYHRIVHDLNGLTAEGFISRLRGAGLVTEPAEPAPNRPHHVSIYLKGVGWIGFEFPGASIPKDDPIKSLDYELLADRVLTPILGIGDIRSDPRIDFVGGIRGPGELVKRVDSGEAAVAFSMFPTSIEQLIAIADAGAIMPPKSTWFEPKLRSGLVVHTLD
ncbi:MAG: DUF1015 domain-containing protein [Phycisphaerae bacterium]|nr:DUF1015 domain-containing protein [Phycisphaerae bacterium]